MGCVAVYEVGGPIWGVGRTEEEAIKDARIWLEDPRRLNVDDLHKPDMIEGEFRICSSNNITMHYVSQYGGDVEYHVNNEVDEPYLALDRTPAWSV
jgi:hypothetical protein